MLEAYDSNKMPRPNSANLMEAFLDSTSNKLITEDNDPGGGGYAYPAAWKAFMKDMAQELGLKGKNLFHPARLAITGEFSGQDVTKQITLLALAR
jgi:glutamyl-tRNA synthetase